MRGDAPAHLVPRSVGRARLRVGEEAVVSGEVSAFAGRLQMLNPQLETSETLAELRAGRLLPVYP